MSTTTNTSSIIYSKDCLVIKIPTGSPAALHYSIMRGLISSLKSQMLMEDRVSAEVDGLVTLADVLGQIVPTETQLVKAF